MNYQAVDLRDASDELQEKTVNMKLRPIDILECRMAGTSDTKKAIALGMHLSEDYYCKIGVNTITNEPEFVWGIASTGDPTLGVPWMLASNKFKITTDWLKRCKKEVLPEMNRTFPILRNFVHKNNTQSIAWLKWLGFSFYDIPVSFSVDGDQADVLLFTKLGGDHLCVNQQQ